MATGIGADGIRNCAVVDLAGADSIAVGALLAERGFAPVVLMNGMTPAANHIVDNAPIVRALAELAQRLAIESAPSPGRIRRDDSADHEQRRRFPR